MYKLIVISALVYINVINSYAQGILQESVNSYGTNVISFSDSYFLTPDEYDDPYAVSFLASYSSKDGQGEYLFVFTINSSRSLEKLESVKTFYFDFDGVTKAAELIDITGEGKYKSGMQTKAIRVPPSQIKYFVLPNEISVDIMGHVFHFDGTTLKALRKLYMEVNE